MNSCIIDSQRSGSDNRLMRFFHKAIHLPKNIYVRHRMATELQSIRTEILAISKRSEQYGLVRIYETTMTSHDHHDTLQGLQHHGESSLFISDDDLVGIDKDKDILLKLLTDGEPQRTVISVLHKLAPPPLLHKLHLSGKLAKVPHWFHCLDNLVFLKLYDSQLKEDDILSHIQALPKLQHLYLSNSYDGQQLYFRSGGFLQLKGLSLGIFRQLNEVIIEQGAMPCLSELTVWACKELKKVPHGIEYLVNLQLLDLYNVSKELVERIRSSGEDRPRIQHIPRIGHHYYDVSTGMINESL